MRSRARRHESLDRRWTQEGTLRLKPLVVRALSLNQPLMSTRESVQQLVQKKRFACMVATHDAYHVHWAFDRPQERKPYHRPKDYSVDPERELACEHDPNDPNP